MNQTNPAPEQDRPVVEQPVVLGTRRSSRLRQEGPGYAAFRVFNAIALAVVCFLTIYPFINIVAQAFSSDSAIAAGRVNLVPVGFNLTTFQHVTSDSMFWLNYRNTVVYTVVATAIAIVLTTTFAYVLSKRHLKGRNFLISVAVITMFFNGGLIPNYVLIQALGMKNTIWAIVLPNAISVFNLLVMKSFFENFPDELEEAGKMDGLNTYGIFGMIVVPLSKAVIATMILFYAVSFWNSWFAAFLYFDRSELYPVTIYLRNLMAAATSGAEPGGTDAAQINANVQAVTMLLTALPIITFYPFIQKYFVSGVMLGSVKQ